MTVSLSGYRSAPLGDVTVTDEPEDKEEGPTVHRLDTRQADLGSGLRNLFSTVLSEPIPEDLARLSAELERRLNEAGSSSFDAEDAAEPPDRQDPEC